MSSEANSGWSVDDWCERTGISVGLFYKLPPELRPESVKLRSRRVIAEPPADYLKRVAAMQREAA